MPASSSFRLICGTSMDRSRRTSSKQPPTLPLHQFRQPQPPHIRPHQSAQLFMPLKYLTQILALANLPATALHPPTLLDLGDTRNHLCLRCTCQVLLLLLATTLNLPCLQAMDSIPDLSHKCIRLNINPLCRSNSQVAACSPVILSVV